MFILPINPTAAQPTHNWTGYYAGTHIGNGGAHTDWKSAPGISPFQGAFTSGGVINGFQFGYNRQINHFVWGLEADATLADMEGTARCAIYTYLCDTKIDALGTLAGRAGYAYDKFLFFGKAGGAWMSERAKMTPSASSGQTETFVARKLRWGWTVGAGLEYALTSSLSAKVEYDYLRFTGDVSFSGNEGTNPSVSIAQHIHLVKVGLNYKLGEKSPFERPLWAGSGTPSTTNWTGFYAGVHAGGAFGTSSWNRGDGPLVAAVDNTFAGSGTNDGSILGGQIGYNAQLGPWVVGAELAASWANLDGFARCAVDNTPDSFACHTRMTSLVTLTGRIGQTYGNFLLYGLAGGAYGRESHDAYQGFAGPSFSGSSKNRFGYVVGSGVEYAFTPALSGKIEYNYIDFGKKTVALTGAAGTSNVAIGENVHLVKMGVNYKFGADLWGPAARANASAMFTKAPVVSSGWTMEVGLRYFNSNGKSQQDLVSNLVPGQINSRLIYGGLVSHSAETFVRLDHHSRVFIKGNIGLGSITSGTLYDEDMPPDTTPYSNTIHSIRDSSLRYGSLDLGYNLIDSPAGKVGPYVGYRYFYQRARGFGCDQVASGTICAPGGGAPSDRVVLTATESYRGFALGVNSQMNIAPRWTVEVDAAYMPYLDRAGVDNHWARADINPGPETGKGWGSQIEASVSYAVTPRFSVGVGGRYAYYTTYDGAAGFPANPQASPIKFTSERYGGFVQASYKIGGSGLGFAAAEPEAPVSWAGFYAGGHLGAGFGRANWSDPYPTPVTGDRVKTAGALGGLQAGYNAQFGRTVLGAEIRGSFARIEGNETCFAAFPLPNDAALQCESTTTPMAMATARAGYAFNRSLVYATGGAAAARVNYALNSQATAGGGVDSQTFTNWGWTVGGGLEHALTSRWSVNLDYKYVDFGSRAVNFTVPAIYAAATPNDIKSHMHLMTVGVNYHFAPMR